MEWRDGAGERSDGAGDSLAGNGRSGPAFRSSQPFGGNGPDTSAGAASTGGARELTRRERERLMRRQLMLNAARSVFAERGYADATLDEIAQRAEFGKGTLYNYFEGGKEEILLAVFEDLYAALQELILTTFDADQVRERPFRDVFEVFLTAIFTFFIERQDQFMIMMKEGHRMVFNDEPDKAAYFQDKNERVIEALVPPIEEGQRRGELRDFPAHCVAHMIMGNVKGYHVHMCVSGCRDDNLLGSAPEPRQHAPTPEESAHFLSTFLLDGILCDRDD